MLRNPAGELSGAAVFLQALARRAVEGGTPQLRDAEADPPSGSRWTARLPATAGSCQKSLRQVLWASGSQDLPLLAEPGRRPPPFLRGSAPLPWASPGNRSQPTATVFAYLSRLRRCPICDRLPPVATAGLHKGSIICCLWWLRSRLLGSSFPGALVGVRPGWLQCRLTRAGSAAARSGRGCWRHPGRIESSDVSDAAL